MWEVMENALVHAGTTAPTWFQAVAFRERRHVNFVVVDSGIGILESLRTGHPELGDDVEAIRAAAEKGVKGGRSTGAGYGLAGCRSIAERNRGVFTIWSGRGSLQISSSGKQRSVIERGPTGVGHHGTLVELLLNTNVAIDLPTVFGQKHVVTISELDGLRPSGDATVFLVREEVDSFGFRRDGEPLRLKILNI
jgi:hypothetical protein